MREYKLQMQTMVSGLRWEHTFHQPSDDMALDAAKRMCGPGDFTRFCMSIVLFSMADGGKALAEFKLEETLPSVRML